MIIANLALTWEHFRAAQVRSLVLMKNVLTVIINPAASPAMIGTSRHKPVLHNVAVIINTLVQGHMNTAGGSLAGENIRNVVVLKILIIVLAGMVIAV